MNEKYVVCLNCGKVTPQREFCTYCHSPLIGAFEPPEPNEDGIYIGDTEKGPFKLPLWCLAYHVAVYGVTGTGKTRFAMNLAIQAENAGLNLRILDVEGEWKKIIPYLKKETLYYDVEKDMKVNPFDLKDVGLVRRLLKETIFKSVELEYQDLSPQMNFLLDKCILVSHSIPELIENVIAYRPKVPFRIPNIEATRMALLSRLNPFKDNPVLRRIFYTFRSNINMESIGDRNIIIDLHSLDKRVVYKDEVRLIYNFITIAYLREALSRKETNEVKNVFIADEAQLLVPKILKKATVTDTWATTDFATRLRKRGESFVIITQSPSNIEDDIRRNTQNIFVFRLQDPKDIKAVIGMLGFVHVDELSYFFSILTRLEKRKALFKSSLTNKPLVIRTTELKV
ncbi:MAG: hypothetical protein DRN90_05540 [Thermoproteota archaeon]|nr:MAG: hypothetical protein DRN90_05540 [Candidatus Korarchaeota archaeon]